MLFFLCSVSQRRLSLALHGLRAVHCESVILPEALWIARKPLGLTSGTVDDPDLSFGDTLWSTNITMENHHFSYVTTHYI